MTWKKTFRIIRRQWRRHPKFYNLLLLGVVYLLSFTSDKSAAAVALAIALFLLFWFIYKAPTECLALNRDSQTRCRNNARGLLGGCKLKSHQRMTVSQRLKPRIDVAKLRRGRQQLSAAVHIFGSVGSLIGGLIAAYQFLVA